MKARMKAEEREAIFHCEVCRKPIYEGDNASVAADGVWFCECHGYTLQDAVYQHNEILSKIPWDCGDLGYDTRDEMVEAYRKMKADLAENGDRKLLQVV